MMREHDLGTSSNSVSEPNDFEKAMIQEATLAGAHTLNLLPPHLRLSVITSLTMTHLISEDDPHDVLERMIEALREQLPRAELSVTKPEGRG